MASSTPELCIQFDAKSVSLNIKQGDARAAAQAALAEYNSVLNTLHRAGLHAVGKAGDQKKGEILILVLAPWAKVVELVERERHSDFLHGLLKAVPTQARDFQATPLSPADRLRLVNDYVTSDTTQGGLGITPGNPNYPRVKSVFALHDRQFNETWLHSWTRRQLGLTIAPAELDTIKDQFGESVALYYAFLSSYIQALVFPAFLGLSFWKFGVAYHPAYSFLVVIWSVYLVEWWRIKERKLAIHWGSRGAFRVERRRVEFNAALKKREGSDDDESVFPWWKREARVLTSIPVIALAAAFLTTILTSIFIFEAFVTQLYNGPGKQVVSLLPTILFAGLVPQFLALYHKVALRLTSWENHAHQSTHEYSLTIKTFALSAIVAYLGITLSAFVYVPFGDCLMTYIQATLFAESMKTTSSSSHAEGAHEKAHEGAAKLEPLAADAAKGASKLNASRLQNQMFAFLVTNQIINTFLEIGLPYIMRAFGHVKEKGVKDMKIPGISKGGVEVDKETALLDDVKDQAALPDYALFVDFSEMVTQFGYVAIYSTIWLLAPVMALLNDWLELRSDAFKMTHHTRRPMPTRTDTIGPWLENMSFISWLAALTNGALVYLFRPESRQGIFKFFNYFFQQPTSSFSSADSQAFINTSPAVAASTNAFDKSGVIRTLETSILPAILIAFTASHGYFIIRASMKHLLERIFWKGSLEARELERKERSIKEKYLSGLTSQQQHQDATTTATPERRSLRSTRATQSTTGTDGDVLGGKLWKEEGQATLASFIKAE